MTQVKCTTPNNHAQRNGKVKPQSISVKFKTLNSENKQQIKAQEYLSKKTCKTNTKSKEKQTQKTPQKNEKPPITIATRTVARTVTTAATKTATTKPCKNNTATNSNNVLNDSKRTDLVANQIPGIF